MADESPRRHGILRAIFGRTAGNIASAALLCALAYLYFFSGTRFFLVPSASMEPTLMTNDYLITSKQASYRRGDIVVLADPEDTNAYIVKRIIALGGDFVWIDSGLVSVNNRFLKEPYIKEAPNYQMWPIRIPDACVFLLGDNRNNSQDSHVWEQHWTSAGRIVGKVRFIYSPFDRLGRVQSYTFDK